MLYIVILLYLHYLSYYTSLNKKLKTLRNFVVVYNTHLYRSIKHRFNHFSSICYKMLVSKAPV